MWHTAIKTLCWMLTCAIGLAGGVRASERVALLVGNSDYSGDRIDLANPVNDVGALQTALSQLGFEVIALTDADLSAMRAGLAHFETAASHAEIALFFYAGHGVQYAGDNMLIGTGFAAADADELLAEALPMREVRNALARAAPGAGLVILDACRDAPFGAGNDHAKGLVRTGGGAGMLIAYATDPGNVAYDGEGRNSVFTSALLNNIATPGLDVRLMLGRVRQEVVLSTYGQQVPWVEEALIGETMLVPVAAGQPVPDAAAAELALWRRAAAGDDRALMDYLDAYPEGLFADAARARAQLPVSPMSAPSVSVRDLFAAEPPARVSAALAMIGFAGQRDAALSAWLAGAAGDSPSPQKLYSDATRDAVMLATATAQRLRTDLVALRSLDRLLRLSEPALVAIADIASRDPSAAPALEQAQRDLAAIRKARESVLSRLDQSRDYYDQLLTAAAVFVPDGFTVDTVTSDTTAARAVAGDISLFMKHLHEARDISKKGSYAWLTDFMAKG